MKWEILFFILEYAEFRAAMSLIDGKSRKRPATRGWKIQLKGRLLKDYVSAADF
jgi:hypothetical protein